MKESAKKIIDFIKNNPSILYSLILIIFIPLAIFFNTFIISDNFQKNIDTITQRKAILVENIINTALENKLGDSAKLQTLVEKIQAENSELVNLTITKPDQEKENFTVVATTKSELIGSTLTDVEKTQALLAWNNPEGIAFLDANQSGRFWNITKYLNDENEKKTALISLSFSLADSDNLINRTINNSYLILVLTILVVILLVANHTRLFGYAVSLEKLKEVDQMKDTFISMASHELRSPLTAIQGYLELFRDGNKKTLDTENQRYLDNISHSIKRLGSLINDMLEVSRLEGNRIPITLAPIDTQKLIGESVEELASSAQEKKLKLIYTPLPDLPFALADPERTKQIIINLLSNAIKYTPRGKVELTTKLSKKELLITVADTGMGISPEEQAKLFQKFYRIQTDETKNIVGTGLGLWITRELARKMDGDITLESMSGVGSRFTLHLPVAK
ncbi:MAG: HAMP domain-containing sensor histidine kinase [Candidatus Moraniibacteriota bacterium]